MGRTIKVNGDLILKPAKPGAEALDPTQIPAETIQKLLTADDEAIEIDDS